MQKKNRAQIFDSKQNHTEDNMFQKHRYDKIKDKS